MGFQESPDIACLSWKTHGFDKKDCIGREPIPGIPWKKRDGRGNGKTGERRGIVRAQSVGANLCSARMGIYGPLIGGGIGKRWETKTERGRERKGISAAPTVRINSRIKWSAARQSERGWLARQGAGAIFG